MDYENETQLQSYTTAIRDAVFAAVVTLPFFEGFTARRVRQLPTEPYHLPYLGIYIINETMIPDGDWNAADVRFIHDIQLGFSVQMENNDPLELELTLDRAFWVIMNGLWRDQYLMSFIDTYNPHTGMSNPYNTIIEGVMRASRRHNWGTQRANNETPWAELQYEATLRYRTYWPPIITDELHRIYKEVALMKGGRVYPASEVPRIIEKFEFRPPVEGASTGNGNGGTG